MDLRVFFPHLGGDTPPVLGVPPPAATSNPPSVANLEQLQQPTPETPSSPFPLVEFSSTMNATYQVVSSEVGKVNTNVTYSPITKYKNEPLNKICASRIAESSDYVCYALRKGGGIRVIHKQSVSNRLLSGHATTVEDLAFSVPLPNLLGSVASDGKCIIWELKFDGASGDIIYREALRLCVGDAASGEVTSFHRIVWHPRLQKFALALGNRVVLIELSHDLWQKQVQNSEGVALSIANPHFFVGHTANVNDIAFSTAGDRMYTTSDDGSVRCWAVPTTASDKPAGVDITDVLFSFKPYNGAPVHRIGLLHLADGSLNIITSDASTQKFTVFSSSGNQVTPTPVHQLEVVPQSSAAKMTLRWVVVNNDMLIVFDSESAYMLALKLSTPAGNATRFHSLLQIPMDVPVLSSFARFNAKQQIHDLEIYCIQPKTIQNVKMSIRACFAGATSSSAVGGSTESAAAPTQAPKAAAPAAQPPLAAPTPVAAQPPAGQQIPRTRTPELLTPSVLLTRKGSSSSNKPMRPPAAVAQPSSATVSHPSAAPVAAVSSSQASPDMQAMADMVSGIVQQSHNSLLAKIEEQAKRNSEEERERQKLLLKAFSVTLNGIPATVEEIIREQMQSDEFVERVAVSVSEHINGELKASLQRTSTEVQQLVPAISQSIQNNLMQGQGSVLDTLQATTSRQMSAAFRNSFIENVIPAFEAGCRNIVDQLGRAVQTGNAGHGAPAAANQQQQHVAAASQQPAPAQALLQSPNLPQGLAEDPKMIKVMESLTNGQYENAFYDALCSENLNITVATCRQVDRVALFNMNPLPLSQGILLTLLQQLSVDLRTDTETKILWLHNVYFKLNPQDPSISTYVHQYIGSLKANLVEIAPLFSNSNSWSASAIAFRELWAKLQGPN